MIAVHRNFLTCFLLQSWAHLEHPDIVTSLQIWHHEGLYICICHRALFGLPFNFQCYFSVKCKREWKWGVKLQKYRTGEIHNQKSMLSVEICYHAITRSVYLWQGKMNSTRFLSLHRLWVSKKTSMQEVSSVVKHLCKVKRKSSTWQPA